MIKLLEHNLTIRINRIVYKTEKDILKNFIRDRREFNGLVFYVKGGHKFSMSCGEKFSTSDGDLLFIPYGSSYVNQVIEKGIEYYQIEFSLIKNGEEYSLFDSCKIISRPYSDKYYQYFAKIINLYNQDELIKEIFVFNQLFCILDEFVKEAYNTKTKNKIATKIMPTIEYINNHFAENTPIEALAKISEISVSRLEKKFLQYIGKTPIAYRNSVRIERAKILLYGGFSIAETSERVGFSDVYYFAKTFKKITGTTPGAFIKNSTP